MFQTTRRSRGSLACALLAATIFTTPALAGTLVGTVIDSSGTAGLEGAQIELPDLGRVTAAEAGGVFRFADVPAGTYSIVARYAGAEPYSGTVTVTETGVSNTEVRMTAGQDAASTILVVGQQANLGNSIARQRTADGVETVLTRDAVGQFPDQNVAEAIRRAPGVNILNDQGEGRFVSVRGLDPNLNAASINGNRVPAPESDVRSVALDVIPSELVESIEIKKTLTPDMDADTIGASIEINTTSAFDRKKPFVAVKAEGSYNDKTEKWSPKGSVDFATRLTDDFGISGGLSYYRRRFATDGIEADDWDENDGITSAKTFEFRDYDVTRKRLGASLSLDWRPSDATTLFARGLYSRFADQEYRRRLLLEMDGDPYAGDANTASFRSDDGEINVERDLKDRFEVQHIKTLSVGGKTETGPWTFRYEGAYSYSDEKENGSIDPITFRHQFEEPGELGITFDYSRLGRPSLSIDEGSDAFYDPANYEFDKIERTTRSLSKDREYTGRVDITRSFPLASGDFALQAGSKVRLRKKIFDYTQDKYEGVEGDLTLADVLGKQSYSLGLIDPVVSPGAERDLLSDGFGRFELNEFDSAYESAAADYRVKEDIYASYVLGRYDSTSFHVIGGVRVEHTRNDIVGNRVETIEEGGEDGEDLLTVSPLRFKRRYTDWLPSISARFLPTSNVVLRAGAFKSVVRPNIGQIAPRFLVEQSDDGEREGEFGNPNLKPYRAWNLDLSAEYYFARNAVVQAGFFYKSIKDFIVTGEFEGDENDPFGGSFNGIGYDQATIPINGDKATVKGVEFSYQQALSFLPAPFDGLLVNFNYTYTDAEGKVPINGLEARKIPLPASSKHTFNAVLGYEKGPVSVRLAGAYRSGYLDELGGDAEEDRYVKSHFQFDVTAKYRVIKNIQIFAEFVNLNNEPYLAYQRGPASDRLLQYETYSWTGKFGVSANF